MFFALLLATCMAVCCGDNVMKVTIPDGDSISSSVGAVIPSVDQTVVMENMDRRGLNGLGRGRRLVDCTFFPSAAETPMTISNHCEIDAVSGMNVGTGKYLTLKGSITTDPATYITLTTASAANRHFVVSGTINLSYLKLIHKREGATKYNGGCIYIAENGILKLSYIVMENCIGKDGGALYLRKATKIEIIYVTIITAVADQFGGGIWMSECPDATMEHVNITSTHAKKGGGGLYVTSYAKVTITDSTFKSCTADGSATDSNGGALYINAGASVEVTSTSFDSNTATIKGGAAFIKGDGTLTFNNDINFNNNQDRSGTTSSATLYKFSGSVTFKTCTNTEGDVFLKTAGSVQRIGTITTNTQPDCLKPKICSFSSTATDQTTVVADDCTLSKQVDVLATKYLKLEGSKKDLPYIAIKTDGSTSDSGRHFEATKATINLSYLSLLGNGNKADDGGCLCVTEGTLILNYIVMKNCRATNNGGGVYTAAAIKVVMSHVTIVRPIADKSGGGIWIGSCPDVNLHQLEIDSAHAKDGQGGGLYVSGTTSKVTITYSTFKSCKADGEYTNEGNGNGGAITIIGARVVVTSIKFIANYAQNSGGAVYVRGNGWIDFEAGIYFDSNHISATDSFATLTNYDATVKFKTCERSDEGAFYSTVSLLTGEGIRTMTVQPACLKLSVCSFSPKDYEQLVTVSANCVINADYGINVAASYYLQLEGSVTDNSDNYITLETSSTGKRLIQSKGTVDLSYLRLLHNQGGKTGGGCIKSHKSGVLKLLHVVLENCIATQGGAIHLLSLTSEIILSYVTIKSSVSDGRGGALLIHLCDNVVMNHVEIYAAKSGERGGGMYADSGSTVSIADSTFTSCTAGTGGSEGDGSDGYGGAIASDATFPSNIRNAPPKVFAELEVNVESFKLIFEDTISIAPP